LLHKATSFRDRHRFTVAIKYGIAWHNPLILLEYLC
jgi:hypothetical protein